jgi:hypothetical protein
MVGCGAELVRVWQECLKPDAVLAVTCTPDQTCTMLSGELAQLIFDIYIARSASRTKSATFSVQNAVIRQKKTTRGDFRHIALAKTREL